MNDDQILAIIAAILLGSQATREENPATRQTFGFDADARDIRVAVITASSVLAETRRG